MQATARGRERAKQNPSISPSKQATHARGRERAKQIPSSYEVAMAWPALASANLCAMRRF
eukprot:4448796-Karenia_brevis.AAC.1